MFCAGKKIKDLARQRGVLNVSYFCYLIDNDSFERGLKSTVKSRVKREHLFGNDWTLLGGEEGVEILHPCEKREIDMLKKMEMATLVGRLEFIHMGHPCGEREYNGVG